MQAIQKIGLIIFGVAMIIFTGMLGLSSHALTEDVIRADNDNHRAAIRQAAEEKGALNKDYGSNLSFISAYRDVLGRAQEIQLDKEIPEGSGEWDVKIGDWKIQEYLLSAIQASASGPVHGNKWLFLFLTFGLSLIGGFLYILPKFTKIPGIKHDHIYHHSLTRGISLQAKFIFPGVVGLGVVLYGIFYLNGQVVWPLITLAVAGLISYLVFWKEDSKDHQPQRSASPNKEGWFGIFVGVYFIVFYILLYWKPEYITNWVTMTDPISEMLNGGAASRWFLYGLIYTLVILVMGVRMLAKYMHNRYQRIRTYSVIFFQTAFAFLLPEILVRLNYPYYDFKNIWPLNYTFFFDYNLDNLIASGGLGIFMLVWGIALIVIAVPVITYFYGKRWYCSWVCGCGGLAETMGDPYRQLSDKSLRAWKYERWIIHGVLVFAVVMTAMVLYSYFTGSNQILIFGSDSVRSWYGFLIGAAFAGVVGTGFYPLMGNRVWCRFGCPLAAYLGLIQRFKSRFRITTNGGQCISCGNCSTYCEMGIDVRWYAQRGQDIVRSSCVGCGVCSAVCPRGVLRLENSSGDIDQRAHQQRVIHITEDEIQMLS